MPLPSTLPDLLAATLRLGAADVPGWSAAERDLVADVDPSRADVRDLRAAIGDGQDPLGEAFCLLRDAARRRRLGQTYTPKVVVRAQIDWLADQATPDRVIDGGTGSGRYLLAAADRWPHAQLVGADVDPVATLMARANLAVRGLAARARVVLADYRDLHPDRIDGVTAYPGNPPYVRHHEIPAERKRWLLHEARRRRLRGSALAGLHVHFFLATAVHAAPGDIGAFITAAEWLDTGYGALVRDLLVGELGGQSVHVLEPDAAPFEGTAVTGAVTTFRIGSRTPAIRLRRVTSTAGLGRLTGGREIERILLADAARWSPLTREVTPNAGARTVTTRDATPAAGRASARATTSGRTGGSGSSDHLETGCLVELGELCRVHRGTATGANAVWVLPRPAAELPAAVQVPAVTRARELFTAGSSLLKSAPLRVVVDLPVDLDELAAEDRDLVDAWLARPDRAQVRHGYLAAHRRAWWSVGLRAPAPILATYMARRPPGFVRNLAGARHLNIAHGLYPREPLTPSQLEALATWLRERTTLDQGRTYAGGLVKFEPREMERLPVPAPEALRELGGTAYALAQTQPSGI